MGKLNSQKFWIGPRFITTTEDIVTRSSGDIHSVHDDSVLNVLIEI